MEPSFASDIRPVFAQFASEMRWRLDLTSYFDVHSNAQKIYDLISSADPDGRMPPPPFPPMSAEQIKTFKAWMDTGYKE
jgi:hypothetical protein